MRFGPLCPQMQEGKAESQQTPPLAGGVEPTQSWYRIVLAVGSEISLLI